MEYLTRSLIFLVTKYVSLKPQQVICKYWQADSKIHEEIPRIFNTKTIEKPTFKKNKFTGLTTDFKTFNKITTIEQCGIAIEIDK